MNLQKVADSIAKVSEGYANKFGIKRDRNWYVLKLQEELGELIQSYLMMTGKARTKNKTDEQIKDDFHKEVADVFCHVLLLAKRFGVDLEKEVGEKWLVYHKDSKLK